MAAIISLQTDKNQILISSKLFLYGAEAIQATGILIIKEINHMYNEPKATFKLNERELRIVFEVDYEIISATDALEITLANTDFRNNFIRIENENVITRSFMGFGLGDNSGHWLTTDKLGTSTTAAHEFGHSLGLDHPSNPDFRGSSSAPPIMAPRGSLVDPKYQWDIKAEAGEYGGTMNPMYRKVSIEEIGMIMDGLSFEKTGIYYLGYLSNKLFDSKGTVVERLG